MPPDLKVVELRPGPVLTDIPGQLRQLADNIEQGLVLDVNGDPFKIQALYAVAVADTFRPIFYGWGAVGERHEVAGIFLHVAQLALTDRERT